MIIADLHCDSLSRVTAERGMRRKYNMSNEHPHLQLFAEFVPKKDDTPEARRRRLMHLTDVYISERTRLDLVPILAPRDIDYALATDRSMSMLTVEGGGGLFADSEELNTLYYAGMRVLGIAWDTNELAAASGAEFDTGLTKEGRELVLRASEMGVILDVSHLSDRSTAELLDLTPYPVIATHSNMREVCVHPRNLPLNLARQIASRGGVIGISLYPPHLNASGSATTDDILRHIDYALEHLGEDAVSFGFDIDGTSGSYPVGINEDDSIHDRVVELLTRHYSSTVVEKIAGANAIDFFRSNLPG